MPSLTSFNAVYASGIYVPDAAMVSALSLLFEQVYLPRNWALIEEFAKKYRFVGGPATVEEFFEDGKLKIKSVDWSQSDGSELFPSLTPAQKQTGILYLLRGQQFAHHYKSLFREVFVTNISDDGQLIADEDGELITVDVQKPNKTTAMVSLALSAFDEDDVPRLLSEGWIPVVDTISNSRLPAEGLDEMSARQIASLLAMKSVGIVFPKTRAVRPEVILETRARLSEHLPPFWSAMLKLSVEMKSRIKECASMQDVLFEAQFLVDTLVLPTLIDLQQKMLKDKKDWFYGILAPVQKGIRLMIGNPPLTQQQLLTNALILGSDVIMSAAENMRTIEALKQEAGLTFLLEAEKILSKQDA